MSDASCYVFGMSDIDHDTPNPTAEIENPGSFATRIFHARSALNITQEDLAARAGLQQSTIGHYEGGRREPNLTNLRRLVWATGAGADYLLATRPGVDDCYRESNVAAERQPERRFAVKLIPPADAPEPARALAGDVEIVGKLYVLRAPAHSSEVEREQAARWLGSALADAHADGSPFSWLLLPDNWSLETYAVDTP